MGFSRSDLRVAVPGIRDATMEVPDEQGRFMDNLEIAAIETPCSACGNDMQVEMMAPLEVAKYELAAGTE